MVTTRQERARRWNASDKGLEARRLWRHSNPKKTWIVAAVGRAKSRAKEKGMPFDLTTRYLISILTTHCPVFGTEFVFVGGVVATPQSPSLDRLDPGKGYTKGNVVVISVKANTIKSAYTAEDIAKVADWLKTYETQKEEN